MKGGGFQQSRSRRKREGSSDHRACKGVPTKKTQSTTGEKGRYLILAELTKGGSQNFSIEGKRTMSFARGRERLDQIPLSFINAGLANRPCAFMRG